MTKKMQIKLLPNGMIQMETMGVKGEKCLDYIEVLKKLMDLKVIDTKLTEEYYETENIIDNQDRLEIRNDE